MSANTFEMVTYRECDRESDLPRLEVVVSWSDHVRESREISARSVVRNLTAERAEKFSAHFENNAKSPLSLIAATTCEKSKKLKKGRLGKTKESNAGGHRRVAMRKLAVVQIASECVGINPKSRWGSRDAERRRWRSHAERGNEGARFDEFYVNARGISLTPGYLTFPATRIAIGLQVGGVVGFLHPPLMQKAVLPNFSGQGLSKPLGLPRASLPASVVFPGSLEPKLAAGVLKR